MANPQLFTIGYQQATQPGLIALLQEHGITLLADVRARAQSRKPGFSKSNLAASLAEEGIAYRHFRDLGTPPEGRAAARRGDRETLREVYSGQLELPEALAAMAELRALALERVTCLLCYCREAEKCHRHLLVEAAFDDFAVTDLQPAIA
ncbi:DUF488 family protein [Alteraurantiacibacter aquimixticola]|uniref:DUF488 domain-containing protein n=1 Tax=Alteraurantiacibacter aquimixticola TaxID=2489173 RepID=A0A4T3F3Z3_9SPHN|nr:DUF488 domain-containing protein [Alteraurantiacibacter aquimixticola]TIX52015.1 DUF488 domain-containing protein [Alteraurantiacibacter aquimixticola]